MALVLYHGSDHLIEHPKFGIGKLWNDYGRGFYCTEDPDLAREWSVGENRDGFSNQYSLDTTDLSILDLNQPDLNALHWITLLLQNRVFELTSDFSRDAKEYLTEHYTIDYEKYDVIIGYRADDSYFTFAQAFLNNMISVRTLSNALCLGNLGQQVVLKSPEAFEQICFERAETVSADIWYPRKERRDAKARRDYQEMKYGKPQKDDVYILDLIRKS